MYMAVMHLMHKAPKPYALKVVCYGIDCVVRIGAYAPCIAVYTGVYSMHPWAVRPLVWVLKWPVRAGDCLQDIPCTRLYMAHTRLYLTKRTVVKKPP